MKLVFSPQALAELLEARDWYEARAAGLGFEFARAVDAAAEKIRRMPLAYPVVQQVYRHCVLRRFPYSLIYRQHEQELVVVAVFHHRRRPASWQDDS